METHAFSDLEGLRIAVEMEKRGAEFYRRAVRLTKSPDVAALLSELAEEEERHATEFARLIANQCDGRYAEAVTDYSPETSAYLSAVAADVVFTGGLMEIGRLGGFDDMAAILTTAIESEKNSILFYAELRDLSGDPCAQSVFAKIIAQEKTHLSKLQQQLLSC